MDLNNSLNNFIMESINTKNLSAKTIIAYKSDIKDFISYKENNKKQKMDSQFIINYINALNIERKLKDSTIRRKIISLKLFTTYLCDRGIISSYPFSKLKFKYKKEYKLPKTLTKDEVKKLIKTVSSSFSMNDTPFKIFEGIRNTAILDLLISTGIRIGELSSMQLSDIHLSERTVLIHGKGRKERIIYISSNETYDNIKKWLDLRSTILCFSYNVFVNRYGGSLSIHGIEDIYSKYRDLAKINPSSTPHYLRHTFATNLLANGADIRSVQEILGHSNISTTEIYTEVSITRKQEVLMKYNFRNNL